MLTLMNFLQKVLQGEKKWNRALIQMVKQYVITTNKYHYLQQQKMQQLLRCSAKMKPLEKVKRAVVLAMLKRFNLI